MDKLDIKKFDQEFLTNIKKLADALEVEPEIFIENIIIKRLADDQAKNDVYGAAPSLMPEFIAYDGKLQRGHELYKILYNIERRQLERGRLEQIQATGIPFNMLPAEDQEILKRFNQDPESLEKRKQENELYEEYKADLEAQGLKPFYTEKDLEE